jgi:DNA repair exonuclease SbcCD ATPase subunit
MSEKDWLELESPRGSIPFEKAADFFIAVKDASRDATLQEKVASLRNRLKTASLEKRADSGQVSQMTGNDPMATLGNAGGHITSREELATNPSESIDRFPINPINVSAPGPSFTPEEMEQARIQEVLYQEAILNALQKNEEAKHYKQVLEESEQEKELLNQQLQEASMSAQQQSQAAQQHAQLAQNLNQQVVQQQLTHEQLQQELAQKDQNYLKMLTAIQNYQNQVQQAALQLPVPPAGPMPVAPPGNAMGGMVTQQPPQQGVPQEQPVAPGGEEGMPKMAHPFLLSRRTRF